MQKNGIEDVWSKDASESTVVPTSNKQIMFEEKTDCKDQKSKKKCQLLKEKNGGKGCKKKSTKKNCKKTCGLCDDGKLVSECIFWIFLKAE